MKRMIFTLPLLAALALISCQNSPQTRTSESAPNQPPAAAGEAAKSAAKQVQPAIRETELPAGTVLEVRIDQGLSTARNKAGDTFDASLDEPVSAGGREVLPKGSKVIGHVTSAKTSGRLEGRGVLGITLNSIEHNGTTYRIVTSLDTKTTKAHKKRNIEIIGGGTGVGALIGAIAGGGKGAAIGAAAGAGAGTAGAAATGKKDVVIPAETAFRFTLKEPVRIKE